MKMIRDRVEKNRIEFQLEMIEGAVAIEIMAMTDIEMIEIEILAMRKIEMKIFTVKIIG
jgi:hypothetical protein